MSPPHLNRATRLRSLCGSQLLLPRWRLYRASSLPGRPSTYSRKCITSLLTALSGGKFRIASHTKSTSPRGCTEDCRGLQSRDGPIACCQYGVDPVLFKKNKVFLQDTKKMQGTKISKNMVFYFSLLQAPKKYIFI